MKGLGVGGGKGLAAGGVKANVDAGGGGEAAFRAGEEAGKTYYGGVADAREYAAGEAAASRYAKLAQGNKASYVVLPLAPGRQVSPWRRDVSRLLLRCP